MKWIVEDSLSKFPFWGGAVDTVKEMTEDQLDEMEQILEDSAPEEGYTDTAINDIFWHDRDWVYSQVGNPDYPKIFNVKHPDGRSIKILVESEDEETELREAMQVSSLEELEGEGEGDEDERFEDFDNSTFEETKFWKITGMFGNVEIVKTEDDFDAEDVEKDYDLKHCSIVQLSEAQEKYVDWFDFDQEKFTWDPNDKLFDKYEIPVYAIYRICEKVLNPDGTLDYYDVPDTFALNEYNRNLELGEDDVKRIDAFIEDLHKAIPDGFTIMWDKESCESPSFESKPAFGLGIECVSLYVYKK